MVFAGQFRFAESDLVSLSALAHLSYCHRRCALIHVERIWQENRFTAEGRVLHERAHEEDIEVRGDTRIARAVRLRSLRLGLAGIADVVEFRRAEFDTPESTSCVLSGVSGRWVPFPVEYKRGKPKIDDCDRVQVCAQALCLEEMLNVTIETGALYYGKPRRRQEVSFDGPLREETRSLSERLHQLLDSGQTPAAEYKPRCENCSLINRCMPDIACKNRKAGAYIERIINDAVGNGPI